MENQRETFNMDEMRATLPQKRGLSRYYSGKSRSFTCMADVQSVEDLKKQEPPDAKKRKKYSTRMEPVSPPFPCRRVSSYTHVAIPCI